MKKTFFLFVLLLLVPLGFSQEVQAQSGPQRLQPTRSFSSGHYEDRQRQPVLIEERQYDDFEVWTDSGTYSETYFNVSIPTRFGRFNYGRRWVTHDRQTTRQRSGSQRTYRFLQPTRSYRN